MILRKLKATDAPRMLEWMQNDDINKFFRFDGKASTLESVNSFIKSTLHNDKNNLHYAVDLDGVYMGTISLKGIDYESKNAEYAISMHMDAIGKGLSRQATDSILDIAFNELNLERVYLNVLSKNQRAVKFYEKYGFIYEGEFKKHIMHKNQLSDMKWFRMLKSEYESKLSSN